MAMSSTPRPAPNGVDVKAATRLQLVCTRRNLNWTDAVPIVDVRNGLLRTSSAFIMCSHTYYSEPTCPDEFSVRFCSVPDDDVLQLVDTTQLGATIPTPWLHKDVLEAFMEYQRERLADLSEVDVPDACRIAGINAGIAALAQVEPMLINVNWERKSPAPASWTSALGPWSLYRGSLGATRILVCSRETESRPDVFAIFLDLAAKSAVLLPADLTSEALMFASQYDDDPSHVFAPDAAPAKESPKADVVNPLQRPSLLRRSTRFDFAVIPEQAPSIGGDTLAEEAHENPTRDTRTAVGVTSSPITEVVAASPVSPTDKEPVGEDLNAGGHHQLFSKHGGRKCHYCRTSLVDHNLHICGWCNSAFYCSTKCLNADWNLGLHQYLCKGFDRSDDHMMPSFLKPYANALKDLGPSAREIFMTTGGRGFYLIDARGAPRIDVKNSPWVPQSELFSHTLVAYFAKINAASIEDMLASYCPLVDFVVMLRTPTMLTLHMVAIRDVPHNSKDAVCCCRNCIASGTLDSYLGK